MMDFLTSWTFFFIMLAALVVLIGVFLVVRNKKEED
jgi:uncharacterized membrane protein